MLNALAFIDSEFPFNALSTFMSVDEKSPSQERRNGDALQELSRAGFPKSEADWSLFCNSLEHMVKHNSGLTHSLKTDAILRHQYDHPRL